MKKIAISFTLDLGAIYSMYSKANFSLEGDAKRAGYYAAYNATLEDIPGYGFGTYNYSAEKTYDMEIPSRGISGYAGLGLLFQVTPKFLIKVGTGLTYGLTPLGFNSINPENYFNYTLATPANNTTIQSTGANVGLIFKLF